MEETNLDEVIRALAMQAGFDLVGVCSTSEPFVGHDYVQKWLARGHHASMSYLARHAELKASVESILPGARSAIVVGANYAQPNPVIPGKPRIARYALGRDYHRTMRSRLAKMAKALTEQAPHAQFRACVDSAPIYERELANRAGLGWFGKNTMLINSVRGSWFLIGVLLTTAKLTPGTPAHGGCGTCRRCIEACPTGAIVHTDGRWNVDARNCVSYWTIEAPTDRPDAMDTAGWHFGCDICQEVCPFNEVRDSQPMRGRETHDPDFLPSATPPNLEDIATLSAHEWDAWTRGRAIRRAGLDGWKRNTMPNEDPSNSS